MTLESVLKEQIDSVDFVLLTQLGEHLGGIADGSAWAIRMNVREALGKALALSLKTLASELVEAVPEEEENLITTANSRVWFIRGRNDARESLLSEIKKRGLV